MTFPETRVDLNRLIKKIKPELTNESFQIFKNSFSWIVGGSWVDPGEILGGPGGILGGSWGDPGGILGDPGGSWGTIL